MSKSIFYRAAGGGLIGGMSVMSLAIYPTNFLAYVTLLVAGIVAVGAYRDMK